MIKTSEISVARRPHLVSTAGMLGRPISTPGHVFRQVCAGLAFMVGFIVLTGCSSFSKMIEKPKVTLDNLKVQDPTLTGATLVFGLMVDNPNAVALQVDELIYDLEISGRALSSGRLAEGAKVPAREKAIVEIPVAVKYSDLFESVIGLLKNQSSPYRIKGSARIGPFSIPFDKTGEVKLSKGTGD